MKEYFLTIIFFISINICFSQNYIYKGDEQYESTNTWKFKMNARYWTGNPELTVAKKDNDSGYLMISINVPFKSTYIGGTIFIFLEDGSTIKCIDKGIRDYVDNQSIAIYDFTKDEINSLKRKKIVKIRFSILGGYQGKETFTANNKIRNEKELVIKKTISLFNDQNLDKEEKDYYETNIEITKLFE